MKDSGKVFKEEYKKLNPAQREAVDSIDGPVMVVAGPGTGKTQILALRIANILQKTDIKADGILCLTFTNSAVEAMKKRLHRYIGEASEKVNVYTFHSFGMKILGEYFKALNLPEAPKLLEDTDHAIFFEQILNENEWEYLRPRSDRMRYFHDLMSLSSILKRERISSIEFAEEINKAIESLEGDEDNISSRGESKGSLKKETLKEIESLKRSEEIVKFLDLYEKAKKEKNLLDYDDVLECLVKLVEVSDEALSAIRERYLYVLVDEHQDSSRIQNEFLSRVWAPLEKPEIFVVGDDRQLIYGFSGASIDHFKGFAKSFPGAKLVTLVDNYRSTQVILDASHALLKSVMSDSKLISQQKETQKAVPVRLVETETTEEEIMALGLDIKDKVKSIGLNPDDCALLVPKNRQVLPALQILHGLGIPVSTDALGLFGQDEAYTFLRILKIITDGDRVSLARSFLDKTSGLSGIEGHMFLAGENMREFSFDKLLSAPRDLFSESNNAHKWIAKLREWEDFFKNNSPELVIQKIGKELFTDQAKKGGLVSGEEITNTVLDLFKKEKEKLARPKGGNPELTLSQFVLFLEKLASYDEDIPLITKPKEGVKVLTMHSSKGLEFEYVWIAHMDERSLVGGKRMGFTLPPSIAMWLEGNDIDAIKRKLYVAITRAKKYCTLSYSYISKKDTEQELAKVIAELPSEVFKKEKFSLEKKDIQKSKPKNLPEIVKLAAAKYKDRYLSVSLLNNFFDCPWQWYFRNLLQVPEPQVEAMEFGSKIHAALDKILKERKIPTQKELEDMAEGDKEVFKIISRWAKNRLPEIAPSRGSEQSVSAKDDRFPHLNIYGKIDLIENLDAQNVRVTDFKTGSVRKKSEIEKLDEEGRMSGYMRQLAMYSYLIKQSPKWKAEVSESRLEFLEAKNPKEIFYEKSITSEQLDLLVKDIKDYDELVKKGEWVNRPCNYNSYGKNTECEYCKMAEIYKKM
ncbi:ATP-dependent helicase [Candidatus Nomurabacteria bacterium]|nr:ATP-dependent helicase [Candidatus Nomurabacteria bacterium]